MIGGSAPSVFGIIFLCHKKGVNYLKTILSKTINVKNIKFPWLIIIFLLIPSIQLISSQLNILVGGKKSYSIMLLYFKYAPWMIFVIYFMNLLPYANSFREELGWRGYATTELKDNYNVLITSITIFFAARFNNYILGR